jgi:lipopolysaccharide export system protein LptA
MKKISAWCLGVLWVAMIGVMFLVSNAEAAEGKADGVKSLKGGGPIEIVSDRLDAYSDNNLVVFSGNVVATQTDKTIHANQLYVYYKKKDDKDGKAFKKNIEAGDLDRIEAKGNVRLTQGGKIVTGENGVFYNDEQKIILTGNPVLREGENIIKGEKIVVLLNEDRGVVESSKEKRVTATIYPDESKKKKK